VAQSALFANTLCFATAISLLFQTEVFGSPCSDQRLVFPVELVAKFSCGNDLKTTDFHKHVDLRSGPVPVVENRCAPSRTQHIWFSGEAPTKRKSI
jgi:hypothetical protein